MKKVALTQFMRPHGEMRTIYAELPDDVAVMAEGMNIAAEVLTTGEVAQYVTLESEPEENHVVGLATNGPGANKPSMVLARLIRLKHKQREEERPT